MPPRIGFPSSSKTSTSMPSPGPPSVHGLSGMTGSGERRQPTISVPPLMLITGQRSPPTRSKYHVHDSGSHGSPVEPRMRSVERSWPAVEVLARAAEQADRGRRDAEVRDAVRSHDLEEPVGLRASSARPRRRRASRRARDADHLPRAHHPADVGEPEEAVPRAARRTRSRAPSSIVREAARVRVDGPLRLPRRARRVEDHRRAPRRRATSVAPVGRARSRRARATRRRGPAPSATAAPVRRSTITCAHASGTSADAPRRRRA